jgi:Family of unknown function (DUF6157)
MASTNRLNTFISVAEDCPVHRAEVPPTREPKSVPQITYEMLVDQPYKYTSDDVLYAVNGKRRGIARKDFFAKIPPDFRLSPLTKRYGWGVHIDAEGKVALYAVDTTKYAMLAGDASLTQLKGNRSKRRDYGKLKHRFPL